MTGRRAASGLGALLALCLGMAALAQKPAPLTEQVPYPKGYREWVHVKSMIIYDERHPLFSAFGGIHHIYANAVAMKALKTGKPFDDGAVLVFDLLDIARVNGAVAEGKRNFIAVMHRDSRKFTQTEGWGWEVFEGGDANKRAVQTLAAARACSTCHKEVGAKGFTFCDLRD